MLGLAEEGWEETPTDSDHDKGQRRGYDKDDVHLQKEKKIKEEELVKWKALGNYKFGIPDLLPVPSPQCFGTFMPSSVQKILAVSA